MSVNEYEFVRGHSYRKDGKIHAVVEEEGWWEQNDRFELRWHKKYRLMCGTNGLWGLCFAQGPATCKSCLKKMEARNESD